MFSGDLVYINDMSNGVGGAIELEGDEQFSNNLFRTAGDRTPFSQVCGSLGIQFRRVTNFLSHRATGGVYSAVLKCI